MKIFFLNTLLILSISGALSCDKKESRLNIATAANMQFAIKELVADFESKNQIKCNIILGSSGKLLAQIVEQAPYDVFVSADMKYPDELFRLGFTESKPRIYARGQLILWGMNLHEKELRDLSFENIQRFALANPKTAPYGQAAEQVIQYYGWDKALSSKKVFGESIAQTNMFLISKSAQTGLTAQSIIYTDKLNDQPTYTIISEKCYDPIDQGVVIIKNSKLQKDAQIFYNYLLSPEAKQILQKFGYLVE